MNSLAALKEIGDALQPVRNTKPVFTHQIHPYPAKYIPEIPNKIISEFTNERHTILDPFCGSGTTLLEARLLGRGSIGIDLNPIGALIARVKSYCLTPSDKAFFSSYRQQLTEAFDGAPKRNLWIPDIPKINHWFSTEAIRGLSMIVDVIKRVENVNRRRILNLVLSAIVTKVSNQESETRFAARSNVLSLEKILESYINKYDDVLNKLNNLSQIEKLKNTNCQVFLDNTLFTGKLLNKNCVDLIITSPPYLNSFDYYLYHKFRILWLSYPENIAEVFPLTTVQDQEIGSRYKYSGPKGEQVSVFTEEMRTCFQAFNLVLKPAKMMFLVIGDSIVRGDFMKMDEFYEDIAQHTGFQLISKISYPMAGASKSFIATNAVNKHYSSKETHILAFQNINTEKSNGVLNGKPVDKRTPFVVTEIPGKVKARSIYLINTNKVTDFTHGVIKYPAKFIPQIPAWAIDNFTQKGDLVLDPFNGSGTTSVECLVKGRSSQGLDINPVAVLAADVKTTYIPRVDIEKSIDKLKSNLEKLKGSKQITRIEFGLQEFWFDKNALTELFLLKAAIDKVKDEKIQKLMLVSLSSIIKKTSYLDESQLKVKRDHKKVINGVESPMFLFFKRLEKDVLAVQSLAPFAGSATEHIHFQGSAFNLGQHIAGSSNFDLIVTSPPYINAMNYPMYHRYELLLLGLIHPENYIRHQEEYIGTERVYAKDYKQFAPFLPGLSTFSHLNDKLQQIFEREPKRYYITRKYFEEMHCFYHQAYPLLKKGCKMVVVCGRNAIRQVDIDTSTELSKLAQEAGFKETTVFEYEIQKHRFKITRHETAGKIHTDVVVVLEK